MKKIIYSNYTKLIAVILFITSISLCTSTMIKGIGTYLNEKEIIYELESSFYESKHLESLLTAPHVAVYNAYFAYYNSEYSQKDNSQLQKVTDKTILNYIDKRLEELYCKDKVNYYVEWNGTRFTNCNAIDETDLLNKTFYCYTLFDSNGTTRQETSQKRHLYSPIPEISRFDKKSNIKVATSIKDSYVEECRAIWENQADIVNQMVTSALFYLIFAFLLLIYLICVCGIGKDGEHKSMWLDHIWTEVHLALIAGVGVGAVVICAILLDAYDTGHFPYHMMHTIITTLSAIVSVILITSMLSMIRNIKYKKFTESSIIMRIIKWCFGIFVKALIRLRIGFNGYRTLLLRTLSKKTGMILISMLFVYTSLIGMFGFLGYHEALFIVFGVLLFFFGAFVVAYRAKDLDEVKKGVKEVRNGNVAYKIPELKSEDMKVLATNINDIAKGLDESVSAKVKAERMKTELITNVSHDLKTPITSIISYTELLSQTDGLPEEAKDYVAVIAKKSERLKNLTQDLFDISKVQSGNEDVVFEKLDVALLINQSLGEHDNEIQQSELLFCVDAPKDLHIRADGRKMSRVLSNLVNNILKYSMKNTRVFITAVEKDSEVVMEFKNIASYRMNFNADEIVGRFVRGDESRTQEGNGLGLAIAKSYTELCNGKFEIVLDGDLFKALLRFPKDC